MNHRTKENDVVWPLKFLSLLFILICSLLASQRPAGAAPTDPEALKSQANNQIQIAMQLVQEADNMVKANPSREGMRAAVALYVRAGQMAEQANSIFKALAPRRASEEDVKNSSLLVQRCINSIKEIQKVA